MKNTDFSLAITADSSYNLSVKARLSLAVLSIGLLLFALGFTKAFADKTLIASLLAIVMVVSGTAFYAYEIYNHRPMGIKNNGNFMAGLTTRSALAWMLGVAITVFYIVLYWYAEYLGNIINFFTPLSEIMRSKSADQWFVYGVFYTVSVLAMGFKFIFKYRHNRYQVFRTISVMFFQLAFAFLLPAFLSLMQQPEFYFTYFWPLDSYKLRPDWFHSLVDKGGWSLVFLCISVATTFLLTPILTYFYGKRWYCSWVCGCGGLAETAGDPFRQLSNKSTAAWKLERITIHSVLVLVTIMTALLWINSANEGLLLNNFSQGFAKTYGFVIGSLFSGVIGVGFYPLLGSRVWCRFGCPMAAVLGIQQRFFSRFRITTNGGQCISCGNCSTYCEMGIDVKAYAQKGQNIVRASCVGCGVCSAVCPRGVLKLENGPNTDQTRSHYNPITLGNDGIRMEL